MISAAKQKVSRVEFPFDLTRLKRSEGEESERRSEVRRSSVFTVDMEERSDQSNTAVRRAVAKSPQDSRCSIKPVTVRKMYCLSLQFFIVLTLATCLGVMFGRMFQESEKLELLLKNMGGMTGDLSIKPLRQTDYDLTDSGYTGTDDNSLRTTGSDEGDDEVLTPGSQGSIIPSEQVPAPPPLNNGNLSPSAKSRWRTPVRALTFAELHRLNSSNDQLRPNRGTETSSSRPNQAAQHDFNDRKSLNVTSVIPGSLLKLKKWLGDDKVVAVVANGGGEVVADLAVVCGVLHSQGEHFVIDEHLTVEDGALFLTAAENLLTKDARRFIEVLRRVQVLSEVGELRLSGRGQHTVTSLTALITDIDLLHSVIELIQHELHVIKSRPPSGTFLQLNHLADGVQRLLRDMSGSAEFTPGRQLSTTGILTTTAPLTDRH